jgi:hypothetical protein
MNRGLKQRVRHHSDCKCVHFAAHDRILSHRSALLVAEESATRAERRKKLRCNANAGGFRNASVSKPSPVGEPIESGGFDDCGHFLSSVGSGRWELTWCPSVSKHGIMENPWWRIMEVEKIHANITGWWMLVVWNMNFMIFPPYWECYHPNWQTHIVQRGRYMTNQIVNEWGIFATFDYRRV